MPPLVAVLSLMKPCQPWFNSPWIAAVCISCIRFRPRSRLTDGPPASRAALLQAGFSRPCRFRSRSNPSGLLRLVDQMQSVQRTYPTMDCVLDTSHCRCMHHVAARGRSDMADKPIVHAVTDDAVTSLRIPVSR